MELLNKILEEILKSKSIDFPNYKKKTIIRRLNHRIITLGFNNISEYYNYFFKHKSEEIEKLIQLFLINTTEFFREPVYFYYFEILAKNKLNLGKNYFKILSIACSSGEEAYSIGFILNEIKEKNKDFEYNIIAIDIDEDAIEEAKNAIYSELNLQNISKKFLSKYFYNKDDKYVLKKEIFKKSIIFKHQDIFSDNFQIEGLFKFDFIFCRNVLIYFNEILRKRLFSKIIDLMEEDSYLVLGHNEFIDNEFGKYFSQIDPLLKIFKFN